ncbi:hypothetical protein GWK47_048410 [Chionoecetes opilio]|uniref:Uncharacterized protein n=1 Tax=Chionoecetes opilio TaxID=41210 RepID=A0A8J4YCT1_CHIOP|nr:hypothetical protein GWK47_048410 [Chionoecetes opilio]
MFLCSYVSRKDSIGVVLVTRGRHAIHGDPPHPRHGQGGTDGHHSPVLVGHGGPEAWTDWQRTENPEILVKYCLQVYFKLYYDIKVHHRLEDGPKHILTQLRVMRSQPKKVQTAVTFYVGQEHGSHTQNVSSSREASQNLQTLISWQPGQVHEPAFTCSLSGGQIQEILVKPYEVPEFLYPHSEKTQRVVKQVTEAAANSGGAAGQRRVHPGSGPPPGDHALLQV